MHKRFLLWLVPFAIGALVSLHAQTPAAAESAALPAGQIKAAKVTGSVEMTVNAGPKITLHNNDAVPEHATVTTYKEASIVLVFSNGATTQLGAETQLVIDQFLQDPFSAEIKVADLDAEPTVSKTKLHLTHGELVGNVKHLKHDMGSSFVVETPVGAAGIRGTTFRIVFKPNGTGLAFFSLSTVEGNVNFQQPGAGGSATAPGTGAAGTTPAGTSNGNGTPSSTTTNGGSSGGVAVTNGQEVLVTVAVTTNPSTGAVTVSAPVVVTGTTNISAATMQAVSQQAVAIVTIADTVTFTAPPPTSSTPSSGSGAKTQESGNSGTGTTPAGTTTPSGTSSASGNGNGTSGTTTTTTTPSKPTTSANPTPASNFSNTPPPVVAPIPPLTPGLGKSD